jgi:hypothetical protein
MAGRKPEKHLIGVPDHLIERQETRKIYKTI